MKAPNCVSDKAKFDMGEQKPTFKINGFTYHTVWVHINDKQLEFLKQNKYSASLVMQEALRQLGFQR